MGRNLRGYLWTNCLYVDVLQEKHEAYGLDLIITGLLQCLWSDGRYSKTIWPQRKYRNVRFRFLLGIQEFFDTIPEEK
jgi:hypothetical protein